MADEGVSDSTPVRELRRVIAEAGLSAADCVEKSDLVARAREAEKVLAAKQCADSAGPPAAPQPAAPASAAAAAKDALTPTSMRLGVYDCTVVGLTPGRRVDGVVMILHGFGASGNDFVPVAHQAAVAPQLQGKNMVFVFPQAPADPRCFGQAAWWEIDVMKWVGALQMGEAGIARLIRDKPPGLDKCRGLLTDLIKDLYSKITAQCGEQAGKAPLILGGFSQGGMTAMDLALAVPAEHKVDHVVVISSAPIVVDEWAEQLKVKGKDLQVLITHGHNDPVLPFQASGWTRDLLSSHGANVRYETHPGAHEMGGPHIMDAVMNFFAEALQSQSSS
mmetsp:Transcript_10150/g.25718  ORF Transcript_10150/g.25718 Transcript_10150/m.25718 type:complete len:334 (+) Transcript_10150:50-1051(+)